MYSFQLSCNTACSLKLTMHCNGQQHVAEKNPPPFSVIKNPGGLASTRPGCIMTALAGSSPHHAAGIKMIAWRDTERLNLVPPGKAINYSSCAFLFDSLAGRQAGHNDLA